jgi:hypothetical protein
VQVIGYRGLETVARGKDTVMSVSAAETSGKRHASASESALKDLVSTGCILERVRSAAGGRSQDTRHRRRSCAGFERTFP